MVEHLSYSSISTYLTCARSWRFRYVDKIKTPKSPELAFGSAFHGTIERFIAGEHKADILSLWGEEWNTQMKNEPPEFELGESPEAFFNQGVGMFTDNGIRQGLLSIKAGQDASGNRIERKVELEVPGVDVPVIGYVDVITDDGVPGDFKTSARAWTTSKAQLEVQPLVYLAALNMAGVETPRFAFRHYVFVKTQKPQFQVLEHTHAAHELSWMFDMIADVWAGICEGVFPPNHTSWKCSPTVCEYWSVCRGRGR
jgi:hypothetical protein